MTDAERLEWYCRHVSETDEHLVSIRKPDRMMAITAFGQITDHEVWYWPMDATNQTFTSLRDAIDFKLTRGRK